MQADRDEAAPTVIVTMTVNGAETTVTIEPRLLLVELLRDVCRLTGTKIGCDTSQCGSCTVSLDGKIVKSCTVLAVQADGRSVQTIDGLARDGELHPIQQAFHDQHALQCGYCTPGMIMACVSLLDASPRPSEEEIRKALKGNICRCTGYTNIIEAVRAVAGAHAGDG